MERLKIGIAPCYRRTMKLNTNNTKRSKIAHTRPKSAIVKCSVEQVKTFVTTAFFQVATDGMKKTEPRSVKSKQKVPGLNPGGAA